MNITSVEAIMLEAPIETPYRIATSVIRSFYTTIVKIETDEGIYGIGECIVRQSPRTTKTIVEEILAPVVVGRDPLDIEGIWNDMYKIMRGRGHSRGFMLEAISGIDIALWDIKGKYFKQPIGKLLGGYARKSVPAYASSLMFKAFDVLEKEAEQLVQDGYRSIKIKIGRENINRDIELVKRIRHVVGDGIQLSVDANSFYDAASAIRVGRAIESADIEWFEEPVPADDVEGYKRVRQMIGIPIAAGESEFTIHGINTLLRNECIDIVQPDVARAGGITGSRKIAVLAEAYNKAYAPHTGLSSSLCVFASLQLAAYAPNFLVYENMFIDHPLQRILNVPAPKVVNGSIDVPGGEGLCADIDQEAFRKYRIL